MDKVLNSLTPVIPTKTKNRIKFNHIGDMIQTER